MHRFIISAKAVFSSMSVYLSVNSITKKTIDQILYEFFIYKKWT